jgi:tRNA A37 threonylcarbamoyladenosine dehydratase
MNTRVKMRTRMLPLLGSDGLEKLKNSHVCVFGVGGVGGFVVEALTRSGVEEITIVDNDTVNETNINRQIIALNSTIGMKKVDVARKRILDINPNVTVHTFDTFVTKENATMFDFQSFDYVVDCIDNVSAKLKIIELAKENEVNIISSMGTGNKLNPSMFKITDISKTSVCPLARVIRLELRKRNIKNVKVLYSEEEPIKCDEFVASVPFVPSVAGLLIAREVILDICKS